MFKHTIFPIGDQILGEENGHEFSAMTVKALQVVVSGSVEGTTTHIPETLIVMPTKKPRKPRTPKTPQATAESKCFLQLLMLS